jgi:hypothetical protein
MDSTIRILVITAILSETGWGNQARLITKLEAEGLVRAMLHADGWTALPGFALDSRNGGEAFIGLAFPDFIFIDATHDNPSGSPTIGRFAVDLATGDVWGHVTCQQYESPALRRLQRNLRGRIGLTDAQYRSIRKPGPFCEPGEKLGIVKMGRPRMGKQ